MTDLADYYSRRAEEYERIYEKPERQEDLRTLKRLVRDLLAGHDVLEVACGTGYWTREIAATARSVLATDVSPEVLELARKKDCPPGRVRFASADAYDLAALDGRFTAGFAAFWWSHVPREDLPRFLAGFHGRLGRGARVVFIDNLFVEGESTPIVFRDQRGDTYQDRTLADGTRHRVLKNFPSEAELRSALERAATDDAVHSLRYFWCLTYRMGGGLPQIA